MLFEIKSRYSGVVIFSLECGSLKLCIQAAVKSKANLYGADLRGADLRGADPYGANLRGADLRGADLYGANLYGANLREANLRGADLYGANLYGADLRGANLRGGKLVGKRPFLQINPIGSRQSCLFAYLTEKGIQLETDCFSGTRAEFEVALESTHDGNEHGKEYRAALAFIDTHFAIWKD